MTSCTLVRFDVLMVWAEGFEPSTSWFQAKHSGQTELRPESAYILERPLSRTFQTSGAIGRDRTYDPPLTRRQLCQLSYNGEINAPLARCFPSLDGVAASRAEIARSVRIGWSARLDLNQHRWIIDPLH